MSDDTQNKSDYWFFLSYSRRDSKGNEGKENPYFERFYKDLALEVGRVAGIPASVPEKDIEFYDREGIETGADWTETLAEALQTSKAMVCLYSPSYFKSEYCGKEFDVFSRRMREYMRQRPNNDRPELIIPVLWENPKLLPQVLPEAVGGIQFADKTFGLSYAEKGASFLLRMGEERAYQEFLMALGIKIKTEVERHALPKLPSLEPLPSIKSAFHLSTAQPQPGVMPQVKGIKIAWFIYVAGGHADYEGVRTTRDCYGASGVEWQPYLPEDENIIGYTASLVATEKGLTPWSVSIDQDLVKTLQQAEESNTMAVIIVDPWSVKLPTFAQPLAAYDAARLSNCGVVIVWNDQDPDMTPQERKSLTDLLTKTFSRSITSKDVVFQPSVRSAGDLRAKLAAAIEEVKGRIYSRARLLRGEVGAEDDPFPQLPTANSAPAANQDSTKGV